MSQRNPAIPNAILMTVLGAAALGGLAVLARTKAGKAVRSRLSDLARGFRGRDGASDSADDDAVHAMFI